MRSRPPVLIVLAICIWWGHVNAQDPAKAQPAESIVTTADMREHAGKEFKEADAHLNKVFNKLLSRLNDKVQKDRLREVERAWLKYRDANAEFEASLYEGGSIQPQIHAASLTAMTQNRAKELQLILDSDFD